MPDEIDRTQYHNGFYAAMKVEYGLRKAPVAAVESGGAEVMGGRRSVQEPLLRNAV